MKFTIGVLKYTALQLLGLGIILLFAVVCKYCFPKFTSEYGFVIICLLLFIFSIFGFILLCQYCSSTYGKTQKYFHYFGTGALVSFFYSSIGIALITLTMEISRYLRYNRYSFQMNTDDLSEIGYIIIVLFVALLIEFIIITFFYEQFNSKNK